LKTQAATRNDALRLELITAKQMVHALLTAVENPPSGVDVIEVPEMRR
jgi:hypothetical protein